MYLRIHIYIQVYVCISLIYSVVCIQFSLTLFPLVSDLQILFALEYGWPEGTSYENTDDIID